MATEMNISYRGHSSTTETLLKAMTDSLIHKENIVIRGFGSRFLHWQKSENGAISQSTAQKITFFILKELQEMINNKVHFS
jgi:nucleoid DNA-binding protein